MTEIAPLLLPWFDRHGRKDLPWQQGSDVTGYRVWVSEIMLQQTQVNTVIPYYQRFLAEFPDMRSLASASLDRVLSRWSGLGYYARARNLHRCAGIVCEQFDGCLPHDLEALMELPGIGRSTAGAIRSLAFGKPAAILDGNVKRVLSRVYRVAGWPGTGSVMKELWRLAQANTPAGQVAAYNQAIMDLGATVCLRSRPGCDHCPLSSLCQALQHDEQALYPQRKPARKRPQKHTWMLLHQHRDKLLLERRPAQGVWGGLWSLPEINSLSQLSEWQLGHVGLSEGIRSVNEKLLRHQFSHFELTISLAQISVSDRFVSASGNRVEETSSLQWIERTRLSDIGLPAPVERILLQTNPD